MQRAVEIAPHYALARFQLGFLQFTSGDAAAAEATWRPLEALPGDSPLRLFSGGVRALARRPAPGAIPKRGPGKRRNTHPPPPKPGTSAVNQKQAGLGEGGGRPA